MDTNEKLATAMMQFREHIVAKEKAEADLEALGKRVQSDKENIIRVVKAAGKVGHEFVLAGWTFIVTREEPKGDEEDIPLTDPPMKLVFCRDGVTVLEVPSMK